MKPRRFRLLVVILTLFLCVGSTGFFAWAEAGGLGRLLGLREKTIERIVAETVAKRQAERGQVGEVDLEEAGTIRILLLGLDARKEDAHPHCDAIHLFSIDTKRWTVNLTSVPRGTYAYIPKEKLDWENLDETYLLQHIEDKRKAQERADAEAAAQAGQIPAVEPVSPPQPAPEPPAELTPAQHKAMLEAAFIENRSYLANACSFMGLEYGIEKIESVIGQKHDYLVTVGFSQTMGALRLLGLPPVESLQWLRHRQSYGVGDPQRSHNQAIFLKDLLVSHVDGFADPLAVPLARIFYSLVDTDMDFDTAYALLRGLVASGISQHPDRITLSLKPSFEVKDYHFDAEHPLETLKPFYEHIAPRLSDKDYSDATVEEVQKALVDFVDARLASEETVDDLMEKEIWLQVADDADRERIHFALVERTARSLERSGDVAAATDLVTAYIIEKETLRLSASAKQGRSLLAELVGEQVPAY